MAGNANAPYVPLQVTPGQAGSAFICSSLTRYAKSNDTNHWMAVMNPVWKSLKSSEKYDAALARPQGLMNNNNSSSRSSSSKSNSSNSSSSNSSSSNSSSSKKSSKSSSKSSSSKSKSGGRKKQVASAVKDAVKPAAEAMMESLLGMSTEAFAAQQQKRHEQQAEDRKEKRERQEQNSATQRELLQLLKSSSTAKKKRKLSGTPLMNQKLKKIQKMVDANLLSKDQAEVMKQKAISCYIEENDFEDEDEDE